MASTWIDNHCHLPPGSEGDAWVEAARAAGVTHMVTVGVTKARSVEALAIAARHDDVFATVGVHPHDATEGLDGIPELLTRDGVVAVGEAGLDYHYDHSPRDAQQDIFRRQIALAHEHELPLVVHSRSAWEDTFAILDEEGIPASTVLHCFTGGVDEAAAAHERGLLLSISGIVTFDNADELREAVATAPLSSLMVETDSPYLAPVPHRGKRNQPANVVHVGAAVAGLLDLPTDAVAAATSANAKRFYRLP